MKIIGLEDFTESNKIWRMLFAEFMGTFFLLMVGCGAAMFATPENLVVHVALAFGLIIAAMVQSMGHISGCHINPAISLSFMIVGQCSILKTICYIIVQCAGAISGFYVLYLITPTNHIKINPNIGVTTLADGLSTTQGTVLEAFATFVLVFVIHSVCDERRSEVKFTAPLSIGFTASVCHLWAIHYTGSSLNPARSLGPAVVHGFWTNQWVYWVGPIIGGCIAGLVYKLLFRIRKGEEEASSYDFS